MMAHVMTYLWHTKRCMVWWGCTATKTCNVYTVGNYNVLYI